MCVRDYSIICLAGAGCQAVPVKGSNVAVVSWWLAQISRKRAKERDIKKGGRDGVGGVLKR